MVDFKTTWEKIIDFSPFSKTNTKGGLVNPAYTSQTCSNCGYVDKKNRKSQAAFIQKK